MSENHADAGECLRALTAEAQRYAFPGQDLLPVSLGLQATANAFVLLGLLPEAQAEAILTEHRTALEDKGFDRAWGVTKGELTVRPGAHDFWESRAAGPAGLREIPLAVAAAGTHCVTSAADIRFDWVKVTPAGLRLSFEGVAPGPGPGGHDPHTPIERAMAEISVTDDSGHNYRLAADGVGWSGPRGRIAARWQGQATAEPSPAGLARWLEFAPGRAGTPGRGDTPGRVDLPSPAQVPVGRSDPPWPTPAEGYLAELARVTSYSINGAEVGPRETAEIVATVAESLMAVGALPVTSAWLRDAAGPGEPGWRAPLVSRWGRHANLGGAGFRPAEHLGLAVRLPLEQATAVIESVSARDALVSIQLYGHPWVLGEYWPMITPCFQVRAVDDAGQEHRAVPGGRQGFPGNEGSGSFWLWPPVDPARTSMRVTVSTLWEAAWADIPLPR